MRFDLDEYAHLDSPIHRWDPSAKLIGLMALIFAFAFVEALWLIPALLAIVTGLYAASRLPLRYLRPRLRYPGYFLLGVVIGLPFLSGETVLWRWGILTLRQEGIEAMVLVVCRFLAILVTGLVLLGTTPFLTLMKTMRSLGLPQIMVDLTLLTYRYLHDLRAQVAAMQQAMRLRGAGSRAARGRRQVPFLPNLHDLNQFAALAGTLFVRSYEQSERVYKAMRLRGYGSPTQPIARSPLRLRTWSTLGLVSSLMLAAGLVGAEFLSSSIAPL